MSPSLGNWLVGRPKQYCGVSFWLVLYRKSDTLLLNLIEWSPTGYQSLRLAFNMMKMGHPSFLLEILMIGMLNGEILKIRTRE